VNISFIHILHADRRIQRKRLRYVGHVNRIAIYRLPYAGSSRCGIREYTEREEEAVARRRWIDNLNEDCNELNSNVVEACGRAAYITGTNGGCQCRGDQSEGSRRQRH